jgi:hypothetical protein
MIAQPPEVALDGFLQLTGGAVDSLAHGSCLVSDLDGRVALQAGLHHATFVVTAALVAVLVTEVDFHPGEVANSSRPSMLLSVLI